MGHRHWFGSATTRNVLYVSFGEIRWEELKIVDVQQRGVRWQPSPVQKRKSEEGWLAKGWWVETAPGKLRVLSIAIVPFLSPFFQNNCRLYAPVTVVFIHRLRFARHVEDKSSSLLRCSSIRKKARRRDVKRTIKMFYCSEDLARSTRRKISPTDLVL